MSYITDQETGMSDESPYAEVEKVWMDLIDADNSIQKAAIRI